MPKYLDFVKALVVGERGGAYEAELDRQVADLLAAERATTAEVVRCVKEWQEAFADNTMSGWDRLHRAEAALAALDLEGR